MAPSSAWREPACPRASLYEQSKSFALKWVPRLKSPLAFCFDMRLWYIQMAGPDRIAGLGTSQG